MVLIWQKIIILKKHTKSEDIEKENYILRYPDFMFANYGQINEK